MSIISDFSCSKNGKPQKRGKINLIGRLQLNTERSAEEEKEGIVQLRILRTQVGIPKSIDSPETPALLRFLKKKCNNPTHTKRLVLSATHNKL